MIDWTKPIQTRDGRKARFLGELNNGRFPMVAVFTTDELETADCFGINGNLWSDRESPCNIINVPEPKYRPWKPEEVPPNALIRPRGDDGWSKVLGVDSDGVQLCGRDVVATRSFSHLLTYAEHSIDGGKTWLPCGVKE